MPRVPGSALLRRESDGELIDCALDDLATAGSGLLLHWAAAHRPVDFVFVFHGRFWFALRFGFAFP